MVHNISLVVYKFESSSSSKSHARKEKRPEKFSGLLTSVKESLVFPYVEEYSDT